MATTKITVERVVLTQAYDGLKLLKMKAQDDFAKAKSPKAKRAAEERFYVASDALWALAGAMDAADAKKACRPIPRHDRAFAEMVANNVD